MNISIINQSNGKVNDAELQRVIRAINRQLKEDFAPHWSLIAQVRLEGKIGVDPTSQNPIDMRGDAVIYIWDKSDLPGSIGYHDRNNAGIPFGFVFLDVAEKLEEEWSITLSHEVLELVGDSEVNLLVAGPHPNPAEQRDVFHWYEMCDAVQAETYKLDGVSVSNFILPLYFTGTDEFDGRNDFLGTINKNRTCLKSFGVNPGGYVGFYDPAINNHSTFSLAGDALAEKRIAIKAALKGTRRAIRYQRNIVNSSNNRIQLAKQDYRKSR